MDKDNLIVSKTDMKGRITYGNMHFIKMSQYSEQELLGQPHNILRHQDMPKIVFKLLWERIKNKQVINAYVKNRTKDGGFYWVFANVTASVDKDNNIIGYYSVRRKPSQKGLETVKDLYKTLLDAESTGGIENSAKLLEITLTNRGVDYDEFIINLQK
ncbi:MAG: PAS domain-containing protein [Campylobacterota bacterium]|nr:PAS domain-containing protein [Campylobacterota bacterium]